VHPSIASAAGGPAGAASGPDRPGGAAGGDGARGSSGKAAREGGAAGSDALQTLLATSHTQIIDISPGETTCSAV
jgi:hypothetical protein